MLGLNSVRDRVNGPHWTNESGQYTIEGLRDFAKSWEERYSQGCASLNHETKRKRGELREGSYTWRGHSAMNKICSEIISRVYATLNTTIVLHCLLCLKAKHEVQSPESQY